RLRGRASWPPEAGRGRQGLAQWLRTRDALAGASPVLAPTAKDVIAKLAAAERAESSARAALRARSADLAKLIAEGRSLGIACKRSSVLVTNRTFNPMLGFAVRCSTKFAIAARAVVEQAVAAHDPAAAPRTACPVRLRSDVDRCIR